MRAVHEGSPRIVSKSKNSCRDKIDLLRSRVNLLSGKDKLLMSMYMENGNSFRQLARLTGVNEANVARRIRRITKRLLDGRYIMCIRHRNKLTKTEMAVAKEDRCEAQLQQIPAYQDTQENSGIDGNRR
jgi:predicted DNA-binding protein YlxM (UPF0122 family)